MSAAVAVEQLFCLRRLYVFGGIEVVYWGSLGGPPVLLIDP